MKHAEFTKIPDIAGKVIFVTGGTAGLGLRAVTLFASKKPAHIYISGRSQSKADAVISDLRKKSPGVGLTFVKMDLASLSTVDEAARAFTAASDRLDVLLCNAGIMANPAALSKDGYEIQFATNHLGHALLVKHLLPTLLRTAEKQGDARVVSLTSTGFMVAPKEQGIVFKDLNTVQDYGMGSNWTRYGQSKLAILLYMSEVARRYPTLSTVTVHPGVIKTDLVSSLGFMDRSIVYMTNIGKMVTPEQGVLNSIWACTAPRDGITSGSFYEPVGEPGKHSKWSTDKELAGKLWDWTQDTLANHNI